MSKRILICFLFSFLALTANGFSQTKIDKKKLVGKSFRTKFVLATDGDCRIEITPNDLSSDQEYCEFVSHIKSNTKLKLKDFSDEKNWAKLVFEVEGENDEFEIFLKNDSKRSFQKSFKLAFSDRKISDDVVFPSCDGKNKLDIIRKMGFPSKISREREQKEKWTFDPGWIGGFPCSYDVTYIEMQNGKVVSVSGEI